MTLLIVGLLSNKRLKFPILNTFLLTACAFLALFGFLKFIFRLNKYLLVKTVWLEAIKFFCLPSGLEGLVTLTEITHVNVVKIIIRKCLKCQAIKTENRGYLFTW